MSKRLWPAATVLLLSGLLSAQEISALAIHVRNVRFENFTRLLADQKVNLTRVVQQIEFHSGSQEAIEQAAQAAYADKGYWHAKLRVEISSADGQIDVTLHALDEGRPYKLRQLRWTGVSTFAESDLSELMLLHPGRILERSKIAEGMDAVRRLYLSGGFLSYVAVPEVETNELDGTAELRINVNEGGVFTVLGFDVIGVNPALRTRLLQAWPFKPGDVYRGENVENFVSANAALLPATLSPDIVCRSLDLSNHTVEFVLDFRPQPLACNSQREIQVTSNR